MGIGRLKIAYVLIEDTYRLDDFPAIDPFRLTDDGSYYAAGDAFAVADNGAEGLGRQFTDEIDASVDVAQLVEILTEVRSSPSKRPLTTSK